MLVSIVAYLHRIYVYRVTLSLILPSVFESFLFNPLILFRFTLLLQSSLSFLWRLLIKSLGIFFKGFFPNFPIVAQTMGHEKLNVLQYLTRNIQDFFTYQNKIFEKQIEI